MLLRRCLSGGCFCCSADAAVDVVDVAVIAAGVGVGAGVDVIVNWLCSHLLSCSFGLAKVPNSTLAWLPVQAERRQRTTKRSKLA